MLGWAWGYLSSWMGAGPPSRKTSTPRRQNTQIDRQLYVAPRGSRRPRPDGLLERVRKSHFMRPKQLALGKRIFLGRFVWQLTRTEKDGASCFTAYCRSTHSNQNWYQVRLIFDPKNELSAFACACFAMSNIVCKHTVAVLCAVQCVQEDWKSWADLPTDAPDYVNPNFSRLKDKSRNAFHTPPYQFSGAENSVRDLLSRNAFGPRRHSFLEFDSLFPTRTKVDIDSKRASNSARIVTGNPGGRRGRKKKNAAQPAAS